MDVINFALCWAQQGLETDLNELADQAPEHADVIEEIFTLLEESRGLRMAFSRTKFQKVDPPRLDIAPVQWALQAGLNISYAKVWDDEGKLLHRRIVFAVDESVHNRRLLILGLMPRGDNYESGSDFGQRIVRDYDRFNFPRGKDGGH